MKWHYELEGQSQGPVDVDELVRLLESGTLKTTTLVWRDGMADWKPMSEAGLLKNEQGEELAICAHSGKVLPKHQMVPYGDHFISPEYRDQFVQELMEGGSVSGTDGLVPDDYEVNIGSLLGRGWGILAENFWPMVGVSALAYLLMSAVANLPMGSYIAIIPLVAGMYRYFLNHIRGDRAELADLFISFQKGFVPLMLLNLVALGIPMTLWSIPAIVAVIAAGEEAFEVAAIAGIVTAVTAIPAFYMYVIWMFAPYLVIERDLGFLDSMKVSQKVVHKHFFKIALFYVVMIVFYIAGTLLFCLGFLIAWPWMTAAQSYLFEDIFGGRKGHQFELDKA